MDNSVNDIFDELTALLVKCKTQYSLALIENQRLKRENEILSAKIKVYESSFKAS